jgi:hypothetical protein
MAAQQTGPPTPLSPGSKSAPAASGAILAPPTPVLSAKDDVYELYGGSNYSERRPDPAMPFFAEPAAEDRDGALSTSMGVLTGLAQIAEAAALGWEECPPVSEKGVSLILDSVLKKAICWDDPALEPSEIQQLYEMIFAEYELREKRGESLTPQRNYCSFPTAVLDKRTTSLTQTAGPAVTQCCLHCCS